MNGINLRLGYWGVAKLEAFIIHNRVKRRAKGKKNVNPENRWLSPVKAHGTKKIDTRECGTGFGQ